MVLLYGLFHNPGYLLRCCLLIARINLFLKAWPPVNEYLQKSSIAIFRSAVNCCLWELRLNLRSHLVSYTAPAASPAIDHLDDIFVSCAACAPHALYCLRIIMSREASLPILLGTILINIPLKKRSVCLVLSLALAAIFPETAWWLALLEVLWIEMYTKRLKCFPVRTITLDYLFLLVVCVHYNERNLYIQDTFKIHAFLLFWALLFIYIKNRLLMVYKIATRKQADNNVNQQ